MRYFLTILLTMVMRFLFAQGYEVNGFVIDYTTKQRIPYGKVRIWKEIYPRSDTTYYDSNGIGTVYSKWVEPTYVFVDSLRCDSLGQFTYMIKEQGLYSISVVIKIDTFYRYDVIRMLDVKKSGLKIVLEPPVFCEFSETKNRDDCPICNKKDQCLPAVYGLPVFTSIEEHQAASEKVYYTGDCMFDRYCHARWYCKRCAKLF